MSFINLRGLVIEACTKSVSIWLSEPNSKIFVVSEPYSLNGVTDHSTTTPKCRSIGYDQASQDSNAPHIPSARIGPLGGEYACHQLFQDWSALLRFSCNEALGVYLNNLLL